MLILPLIGYLGLALSFGFMTLSIGKSSSLAASKQHTTYQPLASGLYYLSELVEEYTVVAKKILTRMIYMVIGLQALLYLCDGFPLMLSAIGIFTHVLYLGNLQRFPLVRISDALFILSSVMVLVNHYLWFSHFSSISLAAIPISRYEVPVGPTFTEIASFFGICVWLVPFALFVSLSASDNVLPTMGSEVPGVSGGATATGKRHGMVKVLVDSIREWIINLGITAGWWRPEGRF
ncbi:Golgi apparatus and endoplasmic reticulum integral membrane protein [Blumeria hordei DH14]|uniref:Golgi apparatus and endoplasmic reticulum integral membrane protein n=1 Tax=Blumeria graminis f. sp. hordei (strain DH14) TaxID=546991 RepID=N1J9E0_BLUG1|nr:Golgi apparatus and endoplasmic reticulum integral membrane protein [Blumeria hordei DH14]